MNDAIDHPFAPDLLRADLETLVSYGPRSVKDPEALRQSIDFIESVLAKHGYRTQVDRFDRGAGDCNLLAESAGDDASAPIIEIGAHFDTVEGSPGADDNGSGVIGVLAAAKYFAQRRRRHTVRFCFFGREESGLLGSRAHQAFLNAEQRPFAGCMVFEMIGCRKHERDSQRTPARIPFLMWPPRTGNFIALVADRRSRRLASAYERVVKHPDGDGDGGRAAPLPVYPIKALGGLLKDIMRSDHASYWRAGRPAIMLTDTANFRNAHYHAPTDTVDTIDFDFLSNVAAATARVAETFVAR